MKNKTLLPALTLAMLLSVGCSSAMNSAQPAKQYYMLVPLSAAGGAASTDQAPELSMTVSAVPGLDTDRVQALSSDARLNQYANARWPDHLPEVLTSVIQRSLASSGQFSTVEKGSRKRNDGWLLELEVQQFYGIQNASGNTSTVRVEMNGFIECNDVLSSFTLSDSNSVSDEYLSAVVSAHQRGLDDVTRQLLDQISKTCS
jgi:ABC-type uncharacterized transport system auxiliary subunit